MLGRTREKIINLFGENSGYMSFEALKSEGITVLQMRELEDDGILERFARGWYFCNSCGITKPEDHKYIEVGLVDPEAVICLDSACYLAGIGVLEPEAVKFAVPREDRRKIKCDFATERFFYTHMEDEYIVTRNTRFGTYRYFACERSVFECLHKKDKVDEGNLEAIEAYSLAHAEKIDKYKKFIGDIKRAERLARNMKQTETDCEGQNEE